MKVIARPEVTDGTLTSSSLSAADAPAWNAATVYLANEQCTRSTTHRVYSRNAAGASVTPPEDDPDNWTDMGLMMRWRIFDSTMAQPATASGSMSSAVTGSAVTDVVLLGVIGSSVQITVGGSVVRTVSVPAPVTPYKTVTVHVTGLSASSGQSVGFVLTGSGTVQLAHFLPGESIDLGVTLAEVQCGITDRSTVTTDDFGVTSIVPRAYNRWIHGSVLIPGTDVDRVRPIMEGLRATPAYWMFDDSFSSLCCLGTYAEWTAEVASEESATYTLRVEGMAADDAQIKPGGFVSSSSSGLSLVSSSDNYSVVIESTNGTVFQAGTGLHTLLIGHVFRNGEEVTSTIPESWFRWRRVSLVPQAPPNDDATWNTAYSSGYKQVDVSVDDVLSKAAFNLDIVKP